MRSVGQQDENTDALIWPIKLQGKYATSERRRLGQRHHRFVKDAYFVQGKHPLRRTDQHASHRHGEEPG